MSSQDEKFGSFRYDAKITRLFWEILENKWNNKNKEQQIETSKSKLSSNSQNHERYIEIQSLISECAI